MTHQIRRGQTHRLPDGEHAAMNDEKRLRGMLPLCIVVGRVSGLSVFGILEDNCDQFINLKWESLRGLRVF